jgi:ribonuclease P protein component
MAFTFQKSEKLCSKKIIEKLFSKGNRGFTEFPFRFSWVEVKLDSTFPIQVLITVSKRNFPKAAHRNQIKRQIRELYRTHKNKLYEYFLESDKQFALMISYIAKEKMLHQELSKLFHQSILRLKSDLEKNN